jgi:signal transduction histidine kinase
MIRIRGRVALMVATAAVLPLLVFAFVSVGSLRTGTRQSVVAGNMQLATRAAEQIEQYVAHAIATLQALGADLQGTALETWQQERILRNYVLAFPAFRELALFDATGRLVATSRLAPSKLVLPPPAFDDRGVALSPITIDDDLLPRATAAVRVPAAGGSAGWVAAELRLEEMWRLVDRLRVGREGYALLIDGEGRLLAHGHPDRKALVAHGGDMHDHPLVRDLLDRRPAGPVAAEYTGADGRPVLAVAAILPSLSWVLIVEQPTEDAYGLLQRLEAQLLGVIALALLATIAAGYFWGRSFIDPIFRLLRGTQALADGRLDARVEIDRQDEFRTLGDAFNQMAERLVELQQETRRQERLAMFGRIASGLVHDLSHPIQNIGNNCRLMLRMYDDPEYRETFRRTVEREMRTIKRMFEDLRNLARPIPLERFPIDVARSLGETVEATRLLAERAGVTLVYDPPPGGLTIQGDAFALGRVYRNLILNAIQATAPGGTVTVAARGQDGIARITIADTGCGIPAERLPAIFEDFVTTKRRGLGLGLPIAKKIVEQLGGTIAIESEVGRGTTVVIQLPQATADPAWRTAEAASGGA